MAGGADNLSVDVCGLIATKKVKISNHSICFGSTDIDQGQML
jgi:hypothetical protein